MLAYGHAFGGFIVEAELSGFERLAMSSGLGTGFLAQVRIGSSSESGSASGLDQSEGGQCNPIP